MSDHTPGPWRVHGSPYSLPSIVTDDQVIAERVYNGNTEFIVRACNTHEDLLGIAKGLVAEFISVSDMSSDDNYCELYKMAVAAIAKATNEGSDPR